MTKFNVNRNLSNKWKLRITLLLIFSFFSFILTSNINQAKADAKTDLAKAGSDCNLVKQSIESAKPKDKLKGANMNVDPLDPNKPPRIAVQTENGDLWFSFKYYQDILLGTWGFFFVSEDNPNVYIGLNFGGADESYLWCSSSGVVPDPNAEQLFKWVRDDFINDNWLNSSNTGFKAWLDKWFSDTSNTSNLDIFAEKVGIIGQLVKAGVIDTLVEILQNVGKMLGEIANFLLGLLEKILIVDVNNEGVTKGWAAVKDASNIMLVVALLFIAFFNAIRFQIDYYTAKALIPRLAVAAVAINFSFLITKGIIDFGNILTDYFLNQTMINNILDLNVASNIITGVVVIAGGAALIGAGLGFFLFLIAFIAVGILLAILFFRIGLLYILTIFSPLVFLFSVLPFTRELTKQWWNYITRYAFMGAVISLILFAASSI